MRFFLAFITILSSFSSLAGKKFDEKWMTFPSFTEVVDQFDTKFSGPGKGNSIEFSKKPDGYHIITKSISSNTVISDDLFWSLEEQKFIIKNEKSQGVDTFNPEEYYPMAYAFDHALYYNYPEAHNESITALEGVKKLPDLMLEALCRAYSCKADELNGLKATNIKKVRMTTEVLKEYITLAHKTLLYYSRLRKQNPNYETIVGSVQTKYSNEAVNFWYELTVNDYPEAAQEFLMDDLYDERMLNFAKNMLITCKQDAILFSMGDNDTYPLWYVQEKFNFRKDVAVINTGLASIPFYNVFHVTKYGLKTTLESEDYENNRLAYIGISKIKEASLSIPEFMASLKLENDSKTLKYEGSNIIYQEYSNLSCQLENGDEVIFALNNGYYTFSDLFVLDLIGSNATEHPIVFAAYYHPIATTTNDKKFNLLSYEINAQVRNEKYAPHSRSFEDIVSNYNLVMNDFVFHEKPSKKFVGDQIVYNYTLLFSTLARNLHLADKITEAKDLLTFLETTYPISKLNAGGSLAFYQAQIWNEIGDKTKAIIALETSLELLKKTIETDPDERERIDQTLLYLEQFCEKNDFDYLDQIKSLRLKLNSL